jgi:6-pyruvoyltetrahydropterin/6-carboxytetrahydropterin synthase
MSESFRVELTKDYLVFSAAHFLTFDGDVCERLHGHNYRVSAVVHNPLDENHYVVDFIALRDELREIVAALDHHMLLPETHPKILVRVADQEIEVTFEERRWVFPKDDCVVLPVPNTTTELLARYLGKQLLARFKRRGMTVPSALEIGVDENLGQWGYWNWRP